MSKDTKILIKLFIGYTVFTALISYGDLYFNESHKFNYYNLGIPFWCTPWMFIIGKKFNMFEGDE
ncbi:hypothetical protein BAGA_05500 [Bacillus gaemokensis]|uniref:Uncharacterized protein n=1 Tax=Bacillus gaemokensis TaxID=574375 RepID=A0A073KBK9_9BACI|nr:hypothetical protein BAGA_05500 [Bacillus gaemokensis]KYG38137.1 hypothetical protein AZF08_20530 [Bacillus gaemokensis]